MTDHCAIVGTFADARAVKTRSAFQVIVEIPIEAAADAINKLGGWPLPGAEKPVAIMLLNVPPARIESHPLKTNLEPANRSLAAQAGVLCGESRFQSFLTCHYAAAVNPEMAAGIVRKLCGVDSRSKLDVDPFAAKRWQELVKEYGAWK